MTDPEPQREAILTALERLLAWPEISRSPQLGRFLDYIVNRTLEGAEGSIKAYSIAVDVFGRATDFDPQADPIVRVQARRLRALLSDYYRGPGLGEAVPLSLRGGATLAQVVAELEGLGELDSLSEAWVSIVWGAARRLDLGPAACEDPTCEADHGYTGTLAGDDYNLRISAAAEGQPVVCVIDDAQWVDHVSMQTLTFVGRRLMAEPVTSSATAAWVRASVSATSSSGSEPSTNSVPAPPKAIRQPRTALV